MNFEPQEILSDEDLDLMVMLGGYYLVTPQYTPHPIGRIHWNSPLKSQRT